jgi:hypothetical protein
MGQISRTPHVPENTMPRGISKDLADFKETLEKGVILVGGEAVDNNSIDVDDDTPVSVAVVVNVTGYGPHVGVICAVQGHVDEALQEAYRILEEWEMDHNPDYFKELEKEYGDEASSVFTETFDGLMWELSPEDFIAAIKGTAAEKYIDVVEYEDEPSEMREGVSEGGIRSYGPGKFNTKLDSYAYELTLDGGADREEGGEGNGWYGYVALDHDTTDRIHKIAKEEQDQLTRDEEDLLAKSSAVIFFERSDGIVEADWFDTTDEADELWEEIEAEFEEEEND